MFRNTDTVRRILAHARAARSAKYKNAATASLTQRSHSVGCIVAHDAFVVEPLRAFFRAVEPEAERNNASRAAVVTLTEPAEAGAHRPTNPEV
jgi:hypothetical protein